MQVLERDSLCSRSLRLGKRLGGSHGEMRLAAFAGPFIRDPLKRGIETDKLMPPIHEETALFTREVQHHPVLQE